MTKIKHNKSSTYPPWQTSQFGRPTKYSPDLCRLPVQFGKEGKCTYAHLAAYLNVSKSTIEEWAKMYEEFSHALKVGQAATEAFWVDKYAQDALEKGVKMAQGFAAFHLKQHGWTDLVDHKHSGQVQVVVERGVQPIQVEAQEGEHRLLDHGRESDDPSGKGTFDEQDGEGESDQ